GRRNEYADIFSPSRSIIKPQLFINSRKAVKNLFTLTTKRCPHMGCALKWNSAEHSWDCACHGSRFSDKGKVLDNPANGDLK
ncbi:MAG: Rieske 2Fe-2S domain-containing protein, partial [Ruminococcus sp.]|nr:Rieske 2Fe-2S domain-containing protein [Ruminococcus sp.]